MKDPREVIIRPVITEHSYDQMEGNTFTFEVAKDANKVEIRQAIEAIFDVTVVKVNTLNVKPKPKRVRYQLGKTRTWKKAMVTLKEGDTIELFAYATFPRAASAPPQSRGRLFCWSRVRKANRDAFFDVPYRLGVVTSPRGRGGRPRWRSGARWRHRDAPECRRPGRASCRRSRRGPCSSCSRCSRRHRRTRS